MTYIRSMFNFNSLKDELLRFLGVENLIRSFTEYIEARVDLIKKEIRDEISRQISRIIIHLFVMLTGLLCLAFLSVAAGFWLSEVLGSKTYGFLSVAGFYLVISILVWLGRARAAEALAENLREKMDQKS